MWKKECEKTFQELKSYLKGSPLLATPKLDEKLFLYLVVSNHVVSAALVQDDLLV